jgi:hypothetical protein
VYIFNSRNKLEVSITLHSFKGKAEETALIDSGAMENFINQKMVDRLKLGSKKLEQHIRLRNVDGTLNKTGQITHFTDLIVGQGNQRHKERFYITGLGNVDILLGYPWLRDFNPEINWPTNTLKGPQIEFITILKARHPHLMDKLKQKRQGLTIAKTVTTPDAPEIPERYHEYLDIFATLQAGQLPPHREWDLKVQLIPGAPASISCTPYPLSKAEQTFQDQYIHENLA